MDEEQRDTRSFRLGCIVNDSSGTARKFKFFRVEGMLKVMKKDVP
jgi:hypothetical protein